jgi:PAS domain-containing protein
MVTHSTSETAKAFPTGLSELDRQGIMYLAEKRFEEIYGIPVHPSIGYRLKRFFLRFSPGRA